MSLISTIQRGKQALPPRLMLYGTEGIGKSTFASHAPRPIFIPTEDGLAKIDCDSFPLATSYAAFLGMLQSLLDENHEFLTAVIDSLDWLERLIWDHVCAEHNVTNIEKVDGGYARGYTHALTHWRQLLGLLNRLRMERGLMVIGIAHAKIERFEDPESSAFDRYTPRLNKHASGLICEWSDAVLFAHRKFRTQTEDAGFGRKRAFAAAVGRGGGERILRCVGSATCVAKNRYSLPDELPLSWESFITAMANPPKPCH